MDGGRIWTKTHLGNIQICRTDKRLQYYKKEWVLDCATVQKGIHETTEYLELFLRDLLLNEKTNLIIEIWR